jgi:hypothetical protein
MLNSCADVLRALLDEASASRELANTLRDTQAEYDLRRYADQLCLEVERLKAQNRASGRPDAIEGLLRYRSPHRRIATLSVLSSKLRP